MDKIEQQRFKQLEFCIPNIWDAKTILYVGANKTRFHFQQKIKKSCVTVVEIDEENCEYLNTLDWIHKVIHTDIRPLTLLKQYDLILWSHGPEVLPKDDIPEVVWHLHDHSKLLVLTMPWGKYENVPGTDYPNITPLYVQDFVDPFGRSKMPPGPKVDLLGKKDVNGSNLLIWYQR